MTPSRTQELAVLRSVTYAAMFEYPLSLEQLHASLIGVRADAATVAAWWRNSELLQATIDHQEGLYFPAGRADLLHTRARREALSCDLLARDRRILSVVAAMPFVRMVALSGSLAHLNAERSADLDLFVITAPHRVWSVTLSLLVIARLFGWRRRMCLNYVISEAAMRVEPPDLFSANQIIHLRPVLGGDVFARFVDANPFVREIYPNFALASELRKPPAPTFAEATVGKPSPKPLLERVMSFGVAQAAERAARAVYGWHLNRRAATWQSRDQVRLDTECLKLHTCSHRAAALARYDAAVTEALRRAADKATLAS
ncbi:MAG: hypothetical protein ACRD1W_18625 [Vicinamibacterales bacterium]